VHGRVVNEPLDRAAREREARCGRHRTPPRESLARKLIRGKPFMREFHGHRDFPTRAQLAAALLSVGGTVKRLRSRRLPAARNRGVELGALLPDGINRVRLKTVDLVLVQPTDVIGLEPRRRLRSHLLNYPT
jgi:hypothetical protein